MCDIHAEHALTTLCRKGSGRVPAFTCEASADSCSSPDCSQMETLQPSVKYRPWCLTLERGWKCTCKAENSSLRSFWMRTKPGCCSYRSANLLAHSLTSPGSEKCWPAGHHRECASLLHKVGTSWVPHGFRLSVCVWFLFVCFCFIAGSGTQLKGRELEILGNGARGVQGRMREVLSVKAS